MSNPAEAYGATQFMKGNTKEHISKER